MSVATQPLFPLENSFVRELQALSVPWRAGAAPAPRLLVLNEGLAHELGIDPDALRTSEAVATLVGNVTPEGATPAAQAYAGHQFGGFSPSLGDGRAVLLGELLDVGGARRDLHLKGSGATPFARGGDGKAVVGPMLREYVIGEAMHALGVPTSRALAVVATGEEVVRETMLPGAVLARVAASHLRVGTFEYAARRGGPALVRRLANYAIARHYPQAAEAENPHLAFLEAVVDAQASLIARWMQVGFIHGVMNTDNMTISGETIDYGPCAFMDVFDPATTFSSIDQTGRYAYGNQPRVAQWNLVRLAEALLATLHVEHDAAVAAATDALRSFPERYDEFWRRGMRTKLGLTIEGPQDTTLINDLLSLLQAQHVDYTTCLRMLSSWVRGEPTAVRSLFAQPDVFDEWAERWRRELSAQFEDADSIAVAMDRVNPIYIPRNHLVEEALEAASTGDLTPFTQLLDVLANPFVQRPGLERYAARAPDSFGAYRTFCGT